MRNQRLEIARKKSLQTQTEVAKASGITTVAYGRYERGERMPSVSTAIRIADALGVVDIRELFS